MKLPFKLQAEDVVVGSMLGASGPRPGPCSPRAQQVRNTQMTLTHRPTGLQVSGEVAAGNYSRRQMIEETDKLQIRLMAELEKLVATQLRLPGR